MLQAGLLSYTGGRVRNTIATPTVFGNTPTKNGLLAIAAGAGTFSRNFADLSTANLTSYQGTISAATGRLLGTPTSGAVNQRVIFDLCPTVSGSFDCTINYKASGVNTTAVGILMFDQADDNGSAGTPQNTYWCDATIQFNATRLIKVVAGSAGQVTPGSVLGFAGGDTGNHSLRLTRDSAGHFNIYSDVTNGSGVIPSAGTETQWTSGRCGLFYFANPGPPPSVIDFTISSLSIPGGGGTPAVFHGGFGFDSTGALCVKDGGTPVNYINGFPYDSNGALCVAIGGTISMYYAGLPTDSIGRLVLAASE